MIFNLKHLVDDLAHKYFYPQDVITIGLISCELSWRTPSLIKWGLLHWMRSVVLKYFNKTSIERGQIANLLLPFRDIRPSKTEKRKAYAQWSTEKLWLKGNNLV